jgi:hypothetical protein
VSSELQSTHRTTGGVTAAGTTVTHCPGANGYRADLKATIDRTPAADRKKWHVGGCVPERLTMKTAGNRQPSENRQGFLQTGRVC